jgi:Family of unknown function (DUF6516)
MIYMFSYGDLADLIDWAGVYPMTNGWQVIIRAEWTDVSPGRPHGLSYGLVLKDAKGKRLLGFDNSHAPDGTDDDQPFDHEHRAKNVGQAVPYSFSSAARLRDDFFLRVEEHCIRERQPFEFRVKE